MIKITFVIANVKHKFSDKYIYHKLLTVLQWNITLIYMKVTCCDQEK